MKTIGKTGKLPQNFIQIRRHIRPQLPKCKIKFQLPGDIIAMRYSPHIFINQIGYWLRSPDLSVQQQLSIFVRSLSLGLTNISIHQTIKQMRTFKRFHIQTHPSDNHHFYHIPVLLQHLLLTIKPRGDLQYLFF